MNDTFADYPLMLRGLVGNQPDSTKYNLRYDWFYGPNNCGLPFQETEWFPLEATNWDDAVAEARKEVNKFGLNKHGLQGIVLVSPKNNSFVRFLSFTLKKVLTN